MDEPQQIDKAENLYKEEKPKYLKRVNFSRFDLKSKRGLTILLILLAVPLTIVLALSTQNFHPRASADSTCTADTLNSLQTCVVGLKNNTYDAIHITSMINCDDARKCSIDLSNLQNKTIYGETNWTTGIKRTYVTACDPATQPDATERAKGRCGPIISIGLKKDLTSNITIKDLVLDDGYAAGFDHSEWDRQNCSLPNHGLNLTLVRPIRLLSGRNITIDHVDLKNFNESGIQLNNVHSFTLSNSTVEHGQHLGMVVGSSSLNKRTDTNGQPLGYDYSDNVKIINNKFTHIGMNGLVIYGVKNPDGDINYEENVIENNTFDRVHEHGLYACSDGVNLNSIFSGGMLLLKDTNYLTVQNNTFKNGYCDTCKEAQGAPHNVRGVNMDGSFIENGAPVGTKNVRFLNNIFTNLVGYAFEHDYCTAADRPNPPPGNACPNWKNPEGTGPGWGPLQNIYFKGNIQSGTPGLFIPAGKFGHIVGTNIVFDNSTPPSSTPSRNPSPSVTPPPPTSTPTVSPTRTPTPTTHPSPSPTTAPLPGDFDQNGFVNISDYNVWLAEFQGRAASRLSDADHNGKIDLLDYLVWRNNYHVQ